MTYLNGVGRRSFLKIAAVLGGASTLGALPDFAGAENTPRQTDIPAERAQNESAWDKDRLATENLAQ